MRIKRIILLDKINERLGADKAKYDRKVETAKTEYAEKLVIWNAVYKDKWLQFIGDVKKLLAKGQPVPLSLIPSARDCYRNDSIAQACLDATGDESYEPNSNLIFIKDLLESSDDETVETKEFGLKEIVNGLR